MPPVRPVVLALALFGLAACVRERADASRPVQFRTVPLTWAAGDSLAGALMAAGLGVSDVGVLGPEQGVASRAGTAVLRADRARPADRAAVEAWLRRRPEVAAVGEAAH